MILFDIRHLVEKHVIYSILNRVTFHSQIGPIAGP